MSETADQSATKDSDAYRRFLSDEKPTIDAALKSFASWMMANHKASTAVDTAKGSSKDATKEILAMTRILSQTINRHVIAIVPTRRPESKASMEDDILAQVWNEAIANKSKPTKVLGRSALKSVWKDLELATAFSEQGAGKADDDDSWKEAVQSYLAHFERLLYAHHGDVDLIWGADRGQAELNRRAAERQQRATRRVEVEERQQRVSMPSIEEVAE